MSEETVQNQGDQGEETPVIRELRNRVKELQKELKSQPTREEIREQVLAEQKAEQAIQTQLDSYGLPSGMADVVKERLDGESADDGAVREVLEGLGYDLSQPTQATTEPAPQPQPTQQENDLARVSDLSSQVRALADGGTDPAQALQKKIGAAQSQDEVNQIMAEAGLSESTY